jgi:RNA polymerase sigma factor (sigma-70 family)
MGEAKPVGGDWGGLMARAQGGDAGAYRVLLCQLAPYLRRMAAHHHRERQDAEDAVQDILLTIHAVRQTYDPQRPFKPWLVAIAKRRIADRLRVQLRRSARETILTAEHETFAAPETNLYAEEWEGRELREAVAQLPDGQRRAVTLLKLEEKSLKEASAESGLSVVTLKVSTHRAIKSLRKILDKKAGTL